MDKGLDQGKIFPLYLYLFYMLGMEELFVLDRISLTYIFQIQVPVVLVPRSHVKMEENAKMGMMEDTIVLAEVDSLERTVRMVSHNLNFLTSSNMTTIGLYC